MPTPLILLGEMEDGADLLRGFVKLNVDAAYALRAQSVL